LVFRSADLRTRVRVEFSQSDDKTRPYTIAFYNLAYGDRNGDVPIELKHSNSGFVSLFSMNLTLPFNGS
jgi:hypothetical protein